MDVPHVPGEQDAEPARAPSAETGLAPRRPWYKHPVAQVASAFVVAVLLLLTCGLLSLRNDTSQAPVEDPGDRAVRLCETAVKDRLKAPATAQFSDERISRQPPRYLVAGHVDAQNGFGALVRATWTCTVDGGQVVDVQVFQ